MIDIGKVDLAHFRYLKDVPFEPICDEENKLTLKAEKIFSEWYDMFSDPSVGKITKESFSLFVFQATFNVVDVNAADI